jgi:hypothetical protein
MRSTTGLDEKDTDQLERSLADERVQLASKWFRCLKVDGDVSAENHPLHEAFDHRRSTALIAFATADGGKIVPLKKLGAREMWDGMESVLKVAYRKSPTSAVKDWQKLLSEFDALDSRETELNAQLEGANERKAKAIQDKLARLQQDRERALAKEQEIRELPLREVATPKPGSTDETN